MSLYRCDGCTETIPPNKVRIHCQQCPDYDLCANCAVLGTVTGSHLGSHATTLNKSSGYGPPAAARPGDAAPRSAVPPPPPGPPPPTAYHAGPPPLPGPPQPPTVYHPGPPPGWTHFFDPASWAPTPCFIQLTAALFECMDPGRTGYVTPEAYSAMLDVIGAPLASNVWKQTLSLSVGTNRERQADYALKHVYEVFSIEHAVQPRQTSGRSSLLGGLLDAAMPNQMPLLTPAGWTALCRIDALTGPDKAHADLNRLLHHYRPHIWLERGDVPRHVLPAAAVPEMVARVAAAQAGGEAALRAQQGNLLAGARSADESRMAMNTIGLDYDYTKHTYHYQG